MISITFFHPLLSTSLFFLHPTFPSPPSPPFFPLLLSPLPLPFFILSLPSSSLPPPSLPSPFFPLPSFPLFSPLLHSHFSIYPFLSLSLSFPSFLDPVVSRPSCLRRSSCGLKVRSPLPQRTTGRSWSSWRRNRRYHMRLNADKLHWPT